MRPSGWPAGFLDVQILAVDSCSQENLTDRRLNVSKRHLATMIVVNVNRNQHVVSCSRACF